MMKENAVKLLVTHGALKDVIVSRSAKGARGASDEIGWIVSINGESLCSARRPERIFASLDTVAQTLKDLGVIEYKIINQEMQHNDTILLDSIECDAKNSAPKVLENTVDNKTLISA